jgi:hypothetical protein
MRQSGIRALTVFNVCGFSHNARAKSVRNQAGRNAIDPDIVTPVDFH